MGFLDRAIKKGIGNAISGAVEKVTAEVIAPAANQAAQKVADKTANYANRTAATLDEAARDLNAAGSAAPAASGADAAALSGLFSSFQSAAMGYAGAAARNMKICEKCGSPAGAEEKFCPSCGAALPEMTVGAMYVCPGCGKQNDVGKRFCTDCGAKLPATEAEEAASAAKNAEVLEKWRALLPQFPVWPFGGTELELEDVSSGAPWYSFCAANTPPATLERYRALLKEQGFRPAGQYPSEDMLYKMDGGVCWCFESCEPYGGDANHMSVSFGQREPEGGFDYVKPEPAKKPDLGDVLGGLGGLKDGLGGGLKDLKNKFKF